MQYWIDRYVSLGIISVDKQGKITVIEKKLEGSFGQNSGYMTDPKKFDEKYKYGKEGALSIADACCEQRFFPDE